MEKMSAEKDYTKYSFWITVFVVVMMLGLSFIPPFSIGGIHFRRTNILSDLMTFPGDSVAGCGFDDSADRLFLDEMERREAELREANMLAASQVPEASGPREQSWEIGGFEAADTLQEAGQPIVNGEKVTAIEDYFSGEGVSIGDFCRLLGDATKKRTVRIAFLGDSYIEGDIITADVRDQLQSLYGGSGVGFVPFSTPLAQNRPTIKHAYGGWTNYSVIKKKTVPEEFADKFFISGTISAPDSSGAWTQYEMTAYRKHIAQSGSVRLLFENTGAAALNLTVNDSIERRFTPDPGEQVQQIRVGGTAIKKVRVDVEDANGFIGYGVVFDSPTGIGVDNYSIRSNSGAALFGTSARINSQIGRMLGYDLIVMQYGLNAMSPDVTNYTAYRENMVRVVNYIKRSFPGAAILLLGVGDRSTMENGEFVTMPAVLSMVKEQRAMAKECGVAFWDTFTAMGGQNSMADFVEKGWAAKDYTHLSFGGGKYIAKQLVNALLYAKQQAEAGAEAHHAEDSVAASASERAPMSYDQASGDLAPEIVTGNSAAEALSEEQSNGSHAAQGDSAGISNENTNWHE